MFFSLNNLNNNNNNNNNANANANNINNNANGYRLLSAQGMETLQTFLREHGNDCIRQFVKVHCIFVLGMMHGGFDWMWQGFEYVSRRKVGWAFLNVYLDWKWVFFRVMRYAESVSDCAFV